MAKIDALLDPFTTLDTVKWPYSVAGGGTFAAPGVTGGKLRIYVPSSSVSNTQAVLGTGNYTVAANGTSYDLTNSAIYFQMPTIPADAGGSIDIGIYLQRQSNGTSLGSSDYIRIIKEGGSLFWRIRDGGISGTQNSITYSSSTHAWLRIIESGGTISFQASTNGQSWSTLTSGTRATPSWATSVKVFFIAERIGGVGGGTEFVEYDNVNTLTAGTTYTFTASKVVATPAAVHAGGVDNPPTAGQNSKFQEFFDNFNGTALTVGLWQVSGSPVVSGGRVSLANTSPITKLKTLIRYDLTASYVFVETASPMPTGSDSVGGGNEAAMCIITGSTVYRFVKSNNFLYFQYSTNGEVSYANVASSVAFDANAHRYWRFRSPGGSTIYWETSAEGSVWAIAGATNIGTDFSGVVLELRGSHFGTAQSAASWTIERVNAGTDVIIPTVALGDRTIAVYYPNYNRAASTPGNTAISEIKWNTLTTIIDFSVSFGTSNDGTISGQWIDDTGNIGDNGWTPAKANALIAAAHPRGVEVLLCVGSNSTATSFNNNLATATARSTAAVSIADAMATYGYDGVNFDGETASKITNYRLLWQAVIAEFARRGWRDVGSQTYKSVSITFFGSDASLAKVASIDGCDWVAPMLYVPYDGGTQFSRYLSPISGPGYPWDSYVGSWVAGVNPVPKNKVLPGFSFYAWQYFGVTTHDVATTSVHPEQDWSHINDIVPGGALNPSGTGVAFDATAKEPSYTRTVAGVDEWWSWESAASVQAKADYISANGLGGVVVWMYQHGSLGGTNHPLSDAMLASFSPLLGDSPTGLLKITGSMTSESWILGTQSHGPTGRIDLSGSILESYSSASLPTFTPGWAVTLERPPLRLHVDATTPNGRHYRWGADEPNPEDIPSGLRSSNTIPGGHEAADATLPRKPGIDYADMERLTTLRFIGAGGAVAWEGRLERAPQVSGGQIAISPSAVGWQAHLTDNENVKEIFVDIDLTKWGDVSLARNTALLPSNYNTSAAQVFEDPLGQAPAQRSLIVGPWPADSKPLVETAYDAQGIPIGSVYYAWRRGEVPVGAFNPADPNWGWAVYLGDSDNVQGGGDYISTNTLRSAGPGAGTLLAGTLTRKFASTQFLYASGPAGGDNYQYIIDWTCLAVYGTHGLPLRGTASATTAQGVFASDVIGYAVRKWAPFLTLKADSIDTTNLVLPHLVFTDDTTVAEIVNQANSFHLYDWAVWDEKEFQYYQRGARGKRWRARIGPAQLSETGPQVDRLWESVIVAYDDPAGGSRTVGPPGSGATFEDSRLKDFDPQSPINQLGITRRKKLSMGVSGVDPATGRPEAAIAYGQRFLEEQKQADRSGQATLTGWVEDDRGVLQPYWRVRAGDYITFVDAADTSYRRIVKADCDHTAKTVAVDLDSPPEALDAYLARLDEGAKPLGV